MKNLLSTLTILIITNISAYSVVPTINAPIEIQQIQSNNNDSSQENSDITILKLAYEEFQSKNYPAARIHFQHYTQRMIDSGLQLNAANALMMLGELERHDKNLDQAQENYMRALTIYDNFSEFQQIGEVLIGLAEVARLKGEYQKSLAYIQRSEQILKASGSDYSLSFVYNIKIRLHVALNKEDEAVALLPKLLTLPINKSTANILAHSFSIVGNIARRKENYEQAFQAEMRAVAGYKIIGDEAKMNNQLLQLAFSSGKLGRTNESLKIYKRLYDYYSKINDVKSTAFVLQKQGEHEYTKGNFSESIQFFEEAAKLLSDNNFDKEAEAVQGVLAKVPNLDEKYFGTNISQNIKNFDLDKENMTNASRAVMASELANLALSKGFFSSAEALYNDALTTYTQSNDELGMAASYHGLAKTMIDQQKFSEAEQYAQTSLKLYQKSNRLEAVAASFSFLGEVYTSLNRLNNAEEYYGRAIDIYRNNVDNQKQLAYNYVGLASILHRKNKKPQAYEFLEQSRNIFVSIGDNRGLAELELSKGLLNNQDSNNDVALASLAMAGQLFETQEDSFGAARANLWLGLINLDNKNTEKSQRFLEKSLGFYEKIDHASGSAQVLTALGDLSASNNDADKANAYFDQAIAKLAPLGLNNRILAIEQRKEKIVEMQQQKKPNNNN